MKKTVEDHVYRESGMDHVILRNVPKYTCPEDGRSFVQIPAMGQLHRALALVIAEKATRLIPSEVRFIRDHLGLSNTQFAELMGVTPTHDPTPSAERVQSNPVGNGHLQDAARRNAERRRQELVAVVGASHGPLHIVPEL